MGLPGSAGCWCGCAFYAARQVWWAPGRLPLSVQQWQRREPRVPGRRPRVDAWQGPRFEKRGVAMAPIKVTAGPASPDPRPIFVLPTSPACFSKALRPPCLGERHPLSCSPAPTRRPRGTSRLSVPLISSTGPCGCNIFASFTGLGSLPPITWDSPHGPGPSPRLPFPVHSMGLHQFQEIEYGFPHHMEPSPLPFPAPIGALPYTLPLALSCCWISHSSAKFNLLGPFPAPWDSPCPTVF